MIKLECSVVCSAVVHLRKPFGPKIKRYKIGLERKQNQANDQRPKTQHHHDDGGWRRHGLLYLYVVLVALSHRPTELIGIVVPELPTHTATAKQTTL